MDKEQEISLPDCKKLALRIKDEFFKPINTYKTTIFLCGADFTNKDKIRYKTAQALGDFWYSYQYDIIYPEDIFDELLYSSQSKDLLTLENLLADSVDAIVLIPESPGSFAELGAFANDEKLRQKIICVIDKKYRKDKSFINQGPVKLVKKANKSGIIFIDPSKMNTEVEKISSSLNKIKKSSSKVKDKVSLLQLDNYLLPAIYLLEPVSKDTLKNIVGYATNDETNSFQATTTALTMLIKKKQIELTNSKYKLTLLGKNKFLTLRKTSSRIKTQEETIALDNIRLEILNFKLRKKKLSI